MADPRLGDRCRDDITGFEGVVTGLCQYISGCDQALLQPRVKDDGDKRSGEWFDTDRLSLIDQQVFSRRPVQVGHDLPAPIK